MVENAERIWARILAAPCGYPRGGTRFAIGDGVNLTEQQRDAPGFSPLLWLAVFAAAGPLCFVAPWPTVTAGALLWLCFHRAVSVRLAVVALALTLVGVFRAASAVSRFTEEREQLQTLLRPPTRCVLRARVLDSPVVRDELTRLRVETLEGSCEERALLPGTKLRLYGEPTATALARGDEVEIIAQLGVTRLFRNHELPDPFPLVASEGVNGSGSILSLSPISSGNGLAAMIDRARAFVRSRIEHTFAPEAVGLAKALVLGENDLTDEEDHSFKVSGLAHLLAVSGTHLVFAVVSVTAGLKVLLRRVTPFTRRGDCARGAYLVGMVLAIFYADFAGGSGSAWRAAWMLAASFGVRSLGRQVRAAECVAASVAVGLFVDPLISLDLSFLLSIAATAGLMTLGRAGSRRVAQVKHAGARKLLESMVATLASTIPCSMLLAPLSEETSLLGLVANALAAPFGEAIALPLCLVHTLTAWWPALEQGVALVASGALLVVRQMAFLSARGEGFGVPLLYPDAWQYSATFVVLGAACSCWANPRQSRGLVGGVLLAGVLQWWVAECHIRAQGKPHALRVTFLDVEQGDSALVDLPQGQLMLIDGGGFVGSKVDPGRSVILPLLRKRRRDVVDVVVLSHPHPDHFGGLLSVMAGVTVREFWDTGQGEAEGAGPVYAELLRAAAQQHTWTRRPENLCGLRNYGGAELSVLAPCPGYTPNEPANDNSFVLRIAVGARSVLFVGDAERQEEAQLVATASDRLQSEVLKVGHHGSRTSSSDAFLAAVRPGLAVISCGIRNRFGHPHGSTMTRLQEHGIATWRVDRGGSLQWPAQ